MLIKMRDYSRQETAFRQELLTNAKVVVIGSGQITNFACSYMLGLGIGNIIIFNDGSSGFLMANSDLEAKLKEINDEICCIEIYSNFEPYFIGKADVIADFTNSLDSKIASMDFALKRNINFVSACSDLCNASFESLPSTARLARLFVKSIGDYCKVYDGRQQGNFTSALIASIAVDEIRKFIAPVENDENAHYVVHYSAFSDTRFYQGNIRSFDAVSQNKAKVLIIGAGGIGTYTALNLGIMGMEVDVFDGDAIEPTNLNRQVFYYSAVGKNKALTLAERLRSFGCNINAFGEYFGSSNAVGDYSAIFSCVDNPIARVLLNKIALEKGIPLFDAGVTAFSARAEAFSDGSACFACRRGKEYGTAKGDAESCATIHAPNVVMTNAFAGAFSAGEFFRLINKRSVCEKMMYYSKLSGVRKFRQFAKADCANGHCNCKCHQRRKNV